MKTTAVTAFVFSDSIPQVMGIIKPLSDPPDVPQHRFRAFAATHKTTLKIGRKFTLASVGLQTLKEEV